LSSAQMSIRLAVSFLTSSTLLSADGLNDVRTLLSPNVIAAPGFEPGGAAEKFLLSELDHPMRIFGTDCLVFVFGQPVLPAIARGLRERLLHLRCCSHRIELAHLQGQLHVKSP